MRILVWHGWLLEGAGSNVYTARIVETWRQEGHDVLLLCQEPNPERHPFIDAAGATGRISSIQELGPEPAAGRAVLLRPHIGELLPVFVYDEYEGFRVRTFADLPDQDLDAYLEANVTALRDAARWHGSELVVAGHAFPGAVIARRALQDLPYVVKVHGSDVEYAIRIQRRYLALAREGLEGATAITGASRDVLDRLVALVPSVADRVTVAAPGVEADRFRPMPRRRALLHTAELLDAEPARRRGRTADAARAAAEAVRGRDADALDRLAGSYDQNAPDAPAPSRLRRLADRDGPLVGYLGKLIVQKGVHHLINALALLRPRPRALIIGYGTFREWLEGLVVALDRGDAGAVSFLMDRSPMTSDLSPEEIVAAAGLADDVTFTGRLNHRYAAPAVAAVDVLVVPSILEEAFGMVAVEGTAAGALPLVARHSGLAEVATDLEARIGRPGLLSYQPGPHAARSLAASLHTLLSLTEAERDALSGELSAYARRRWGWQRTARDLLTAAAGGSTS